MWQVISVFRLPCSCRCSSHTPMLEPFLQRCTGPLGLQRSQSTSGLQLYLYALRLWDAAVYSSLRATTSVCNSNSSMVGGYGPDCIKDLHCQGVGQEFHSCINQRCDHTFQPAQQTHVSEVTWGNRSSSRTSPLQTPQHRRQQCNIHCGTTQSTWGDQSTSILHRSASLMPQRHLWQLVRPHTTSSLDLHNIQQGVATSKAKYASHTVQGSIPSSDKHPWNTRSAIVDSSSASAAEQVQHPAAADSEEDVSALIAPMRRAVVGFYNPEHVQVVPVQHEQHHPASKQPETAATHWHSQQQPWQPQQQQLQQGPPQHTQLQLQELPVFACHLGAEINSADFITKNVLHIKDKYPLKDNVVISAAAEGDDVVFMGERGNQQLLNEQIFVIYRHGSVIFFNMRQRSIDRWLERLQPFVGRGDNPPAGHRHDETKLVIDPSLDSWSRLEPDKIVVQTLDAANARVISNVLGQSVALDYYNQEVDKAIQQFTPYLTKVAELGESSDIKDKELLKLIAENSLLYTDVVTKIGLLDISQTAWTQDKYHDLWTALRKDYELDRRFDAINRKLGPMIENAKFLLDIRAEQKSADAEKIIILLIMLEVAISMVGFWL